MSYLDNDTIGACFERFKRHDLMRDKVECVFGELVGQQASAKPLVRWEPTREAFSLCNRRAFAEQPRGSESVNQLSAVHSKHVRGAGQSLYLYAKDVDATEILLARVVITLEKIFLAEKNCRLLNGDWLLSGKHTSSAERYRLDIEIALPVLRIEPAAAAESAPLTEVPVTP